MTPHARVQAAIEVLDAWSGGGDGLDRVLAAWGRANRFAGSGDRRAIADLVYDATRRWRSAVWAAGGDASRDVVRGCLLLDGHNPAELFDGSRHGPAPLTSAEQAPARPLTSAPRAVRLDYPDWLEPHVASLPDAELALLRARAPVDVRANLLRADAVAAREALAAEGIEAVPVPDVPTALRVTGGARKIARSRAYADGLIEVQDAASQLVADAVAVEPGTRLLDLCAGGGGKALALAARMGGQGHVAACDISPARLAEIPDRARRAGAEITLLEAADLTEAAPFDAVLIDAPCSGSGAWRRNPDAKWRLTPDSLDRLLATQAALLGQAAALVRPGGRMVYATCSLFAAENADRIAAFSATHPDWSVTPAQRLPLG